jgi:hypothetical protein
MPKAPKVGGKVMIPRISHGPIAKAKSVTQDFFPRSSSAAEKKTQGYLFNAAPINKNEAKEEAKERFSSQQANKRSAFVARLHDDDGDQETNAFRRSGKNKGVDLKDYEEEMKVFDMEESDKEIEGTPLIKKREQKGAEKGRGEGRSVSRKLRGDAGVKVNRLVSIEMDLTSLNYRNSPLEVSDCLQLLKFIQPI